MEEDNKILEEMAKDNLSIQLMIKNRKKIRAINELRHDHKKLKDKIFDIEHDCEGISDEDREAKRKPLDEAKMKYIKEIGGSWYIDPIF